MARFKAQQNASETGWWARGARENAATGAVEKIDSTTRLGERSNGNEDRRVRRERQGKRYLRSAFKPFHVHFRGRHFVVRSALREVEECAFFSLSLFSLSLSPGTGRNGKRMGVVSATSAMWWTSSPVTMNNAHSASSVNVETK